MAQPKPKSGQKHKPTKPGNAPESQLRERELMLNEVHKAAAKGKVHDEGFEMHDHPEEEQAETPQEEAAEHEGYAHGGMVKCMHCGGMTKYDHGGLVDDALKVAPVAAMLLNKGGKVKKK